MVPINIRWAVPEIIYGLNDSGTKVLIVDKAFVPMLEAFEGKLETVETVLYADDGEAPPGTQSFDALVEASSPAEDACSGGHDMAGIFYTGGTTGLSKGVMLSHRNICVNAMNYIAEVGASHNSTYLHAAPMFHAADAIGTFGYTAAAGSHIFIPRFEPEATLKAVQEEKVNFMILVPTMIQALVDYPAFGNYDMSGVESILYGASPMPVELLKRTLAAIPNARFVHAYGMTETAPLATVLPTEHQNLESDKLKSAGRATFGVQIRIVDEDRNEVPRGTVGEIAMHGANIMLGYWNKPEETAAVVADGWMHSGDAAFMDEDGFITITDRLKDMIVSGSENVYTTEVENALYQHESVAQCAVIGIPSDEWGETVHAVIVPKDGAERDADALIAHCKELIAGYKCPRSVEFRDDPLPLSGAGKILKTELREPYWQDKDRRIN